MKKFGIGLLFVLAAIAYAQQPVNVSKVSTFDTPCYVKNGVGTSNDTTNHANCKASAATFKGGRAISTSGTLAYLRLYNLATDATCSSATGFVESIPIPASATGAGVVDIVSNYKYATGLAYCVTGAGSSTDNSAPPAGVYITISYQ